MFKTSFLLVLNLIFISVLAITLYITIKEKYEESRQEGDPMLERIRDKLSKVHPVIKDIKLYKGKKSYTINKEKVFICLKDEKGKYYNENLLTYVILHELAHVLNPTIGHTDTFFKKFEELKMEAARQGVYDPTQPIDPEYCEY